MILAVIAFCEVAFWILLVGGLAVRYLLGRRRLSAALLISVPLLDVILLTASVIDMRNGAVAGLTHGLAVAYLGYSVAFGHRTIRWADAKFAHRFAGGPPPWKPSPSGTWPRARHEWMMWFRMLLAYAVAWAATGIMLLLVGEPTRTAPLVLFTVGLARFPVIALLWPLSYTYTAYRSSGRPRAPSGEQEVADARRATSPLGRRMP